MATVGQIYPTLIDLQNTWDDNKRTASLITVIDEVSETAKDLVMLEGNQTDGHISVSHIAGDKGTWKSFYQSVVPTADTWTRVKDTCGTLEDWTAIDEDLVKVEDNQDSFRLLQATTKIAGMQRTISKAILTGDTDTHPEQFLGLEKRFNALSTDYTKSGYNIVDAGGQGSDNTSIWFGRSGRGTVFLFYPKGSKAGLERNDLGVETVVDTTTGGMRREYHEQFKQTIGLAVPNWQGIMRVANIDVSDLLSGDVDLLKYMTLAVTKLDHYKLQGRPFCWCNLAVQQALAIQAINRSNLALQYTDWAGGPVLSFWGYPIRPVAAISLLEGQIQ